MDAEAYLSTIEDAATRREAQTIVERILRLPPQDQANVTGWSELEEACFDRAAGGTDTGRILFELAERAPGPAAAWPAFIVSARAYSSLCPGRRANGVAARLARAAGRAVFFVMVRLLGRYGHSLLHASIATAQAEIRSAKLMTLALALQRADARQAGAAEARLGRLRAALEAVYDAQAGPTLARRCVVADEARMRDCLASHLGRHGLG